jgi:NAD-dependent SIR2 family protein deacetylase
VDCEEYGGVLKPDVVFFGENVMKQRVGACNAMVPTPALVVLGSSLTVMSELRYVQRAASLGTPVVIMNQGATRGDDLAAATLDAPFGATLSAVLSPALIA